MWEGARTPAGRYSSSSPPASSRGPPLGWVLSLGPSTSSCSSVGTSSGTPWRAVVNAFPEAPCLLNVRDFDGWYASCENTILAVKKAAMAGEIAEDANREQPSPELWGVIEKLVWQGDFQGRFEDRDWVRDMYFERIETIKREIPSDRLIVWRLGAGWEPICEQLGVDVPDEPFPHLHDTNEFRTEFGLQPI